MGRVRTEPGSRVASARSFDGGFFEVVSQRPTTGTWKRVTLFLRRLSWPCGAGKPGYRERFPRSNCAQERSGRTDRGPAEPQGAHIPKSALLVALRGGGPSDVAADSLIAAAVHYARSGRRFGCGAYRRVP